MANLYLEFEPPLARLKIDNAERRNAMSAAMWRDLPALCRDIESRANILAVVVEGVGEHFCAGADIREFDEVFADSTRARAYLLAIEQGLEALSRVDRPTIAKLQGTAFGGGLALAMGCDLRFAATGAHFCIPPAKLGLLYGPAETRLLVETVGPAVAKDLLFSGRVVEANEAVQMRLISRCVPAAALEQTVLNEVSNWSLLSQASIRGAKKAVRAVIAADVQAVRDLVEAVAMGEDFYEGRAAFKEKRAAKFNS